MKTLSRGLTRIAYALLFLFPFCLGTIYSIKYLTGGWADVYEYHEPKHYFLPELDRFGTAFVLVILFVAVIVILSNALSKLTKSKIVTIVLIILMTVFTRMIVLIIFNGEINPFSDGLYAWQRVHGDMTTLLYVSFFPGWVNYTLFLQGIVNFIGDNYMLVLYSNVIFNALTAVMLFLVCEEAGLSKKVCIGATFAYVLNLTSIIYVTFDTPEHMAIAFNMVALYFIIRGFKNENLINKVIYMAVAGIFLGLSSSVKTFGVIFIVAFLIAEILRMMSSGKEKGILKLFAGCIISCAIMYGLNTAVESGITKISENVYDIELNSADATPHYLLVGLNYTGEGQQHIGEVGKTYIKKRQEGVDLETGKQLVPLILADNWAGHENLKDASEWLNKKLIWAWQDDMCPRTYFLEYTGIDVNSKSEDIVYGFWKNIAPSTMQILYMLLMLLAAVGVIYIFLSKKNENVPNRDMLIDNYPLFMMGMIILGYFCMLLISEAQSRYKCLIIPFIGMFAVIGVEGIVSLIRKRIDKRTKPDKLQRI